MGSSESAEPSRFFAQFTAFVSLALGLIVFIGSWVLEQSLKTLAKWQRDFPRAKPLTMSVNVSPRQFHQTDFVD